MQHALLAAVEKEFSSRAVPDFRPGDAVDVHVRIQEGDKERIQVFSGTVISRKGEGTRTTFIVRRLVQGEGVERVFPLYSPRISKIKVTRGGQVRRAKLYYLREREGKATRVDERMLEAGGVHETPAEAVIAAKVAPPSEKGKGSDKKAKPAKK